MKIKNLTPFPFGTKVTSRRPPRPEMTLVLRATYVIHPSGPLTLPEGPGPLQAQGSMSADLYREDDEARAGECLYPGDFADWKPRAEVMLRGTCHTPSGKPLPECPVRFEVGRWSKILRVVGRRFWSDDLPSAVMSDPAPFTRMPLGYEAAFGGPGYAKNPVGKGFAGRELPNVEHAGRVIRGRRDDPGPAGFGPLNPAWPDRAGKLGTEYGPRWRKERWPYYAEDFDWTYFNAAPPDQQLDGYLRGDEALLFQNLHPAAPVLEARLPGLRIRAFVKDVEQRFREVAMSLDTLFADLDEGRLYLTWRGLDAVGADDLKDVETALVASEKLDDPWLPEAHYRGILEKFEADPLEIADRVSAKAKCRFEAMQRRLADRREGRAPAHAAPAPDPATAAVRQLLDALPIPIDGADALEKSIADAVAEAAGAAGSADLPADVSAKAPPFDLQAELAKGADDMTKALAAPRRPAAVSLRPGGPPPAWAARSLKDLQDAAADAKKALAEQNLGEAVAAAEAQRSGPRGAVPPIEDPAKQIDEGLAAFTSQPFLAKIANRPAPQEPGPGKDLSGQDYEMRDLRGADLRAANLRDANLAGAILRDAQLQGACLEGAVLAGADLTGADLTGADLTLANLTGATAPRAVFRGAVLHRAFFSKAKLAGAIFAGAKGEWTFFPEADLTGVDGKGLTLDQAFARKAILAGADLSGATLTRCYFLDAAGKGVKLGRALLTRTSFQGADLGGATLVEAKGDRTVWLRARLHDADFERALLPNAQMLEARADRVRFRRAVLREARCYRASFEHGDFTEASLVGADLSKCALSRARFTGANLFDAKLVAAAGEGCDFTGANLERALLEAAR